MWFQGLSKATAWQTATYFLGVALFSISFLVFLNSSVSFVITDLIGQKDRVGDAVGTLGFADELLALVACPLWGVTSDRLGVRNVCTLGYLVIGISLFVFVQAKNVYPQLLLARLLFSIGGAAATTMVTAILPAMTADHKESLALESSVAEQEDYVPPSTRSSERTEMTGATETTLTPTRYHDSRPSTQQRGPGRSRSATSQIAGFVGMFTGMGALVALGLFLPLPERLQRTGMPLASAVATSYYIVGTVAFAVALFCALGLRNLRGEENKGWSSVFGHTSSEEGNASGSREKLSAYSDLIMHSVRLGATEAPVGLGYLGGFVARASSVGISLFIPLYVNHYFTSTGRCTGAPVTAPGEIKRQCGKAYIAAAILAGTAESVALVGAPIFGYLDSRYGWSNGPLIVACACGIVGYIMLAKIPEPEPSKQGASIFISMALLGISQIGAIVCSLSLLGRDSSGKSSLEESQSGPVRRRRRRPRDDDDGQTAETQDESSPLLDAQVEGASASASASRPSMSRVELKGSIAGVYSLSGGAGILLLTKLGGYLFDKSSAAAPFYMLAIFNGILLVSAVGCTIATLASTKRNESGRPFIRVG